MDIQTNQTLKVCDRCKTPVSFTDVSNGYVAACPTHDEDLTNIEILEVKPILNQDGKFNNHFLYQIEHPEAHPILQPSRYNQELKFLVQRLGTLNAGDAIEFIDGEPVGIVVDSLTDFTQYLDKESARDLLVEAPSYRVCHENRAIDSTTYTVFDFRNVVSLNGEVSRQVLVNHFGEPYWIALPNGYKAERCKH